MQLRRLSLQNFRQFKSAEVDFLPGLTAIVGPNGSGKTTILEAITWALYGEQRETKGTLKNLWADDGGKVSVKLEFGLGNRAYSVERGENKASLAEFVDGQETGLANSLTEVTKQVERLLGLTYEQFKNSFCAEQKQLEFMGSMDQNRRQNQIAKMLGYDVLRVAAKCAGEMAAEQRAVLKGIEPSLTMAASLEAQHETARDAVKEAEIEHEQRKKEEAEAQGQLAELDPKKQKADEAMAISLRMENRKDVGKTLKASFDEATKETAILEEQVAERERIAPQAAEFERLQQEQGVLQDLRAKAGRRSAVERQLAENCEAAGGLEREISELSDVNVQSLEKSAADAKVAFDSAQKAREAAEAAWAKAKAQADKVASLIEQDLQGKNSEVARFAEAERLGKCPECGQPLPDGHMPKADDLRAAIQTLELERAKTQANLESARKEPDELVQAKKVELAASQKADAANGDLWSGRNLREKRDIKSNQLSEIKAKIAAQEEELKDMPAAFEEAKLQQVEARMRESQLAWKRHLQLANVVADFATATKRRDEARRRFEEEKASQQADEAKLKELGLSPQEAGAVIRQHIEAQGAFTAAGGRRQAAEASLSSRRESLKDNEQALENAKEMKRHAEALRKEEVLRKELGDGFLALRNRLNEETRPLLQTFAGEVLDKLTGSRYSRLKVDERFVPTVFDEDVEKKVISGGEEDVVALALRLALVQMMQERTGQPMSLLILDEVFGSLDPDRRQYVLAKLESLKGMFDQILLISHIEAINDTADRVLMVRYDPQSHSSSIEEPTLDSYSTALYE